MRFRDYFLSTAAIAAVTLTCGVTVRADDDQVNRVKHVLLLSIDGFHQHDLDNCLQSGGCPTLAALARRRNGGMGTDRRRLLAIGLRFAGLT